MAKYLPPANTWTYRPLERVRKPLSFDVVAEYVSSALRAAGIECDFQSDAAGPTQDRKERRGRRWSIAPVAITWTRAARRNRTQVPAADVSQVSLFRACMRVETVARDVRERSPDGKEQEDIVISLDWLRGRDRKVIDGLWALLIRKVGDAVRTA